MPSMIQILKNRRKSPIEERLSNINPKYYFVVSGLLAMLLSFLGFSFLEMLGTGKNIILVGDVYEQYVPFLSEVSESIRNHETIWYSFSPVLGSSTAYLLMFTCWSPFNLLYLLLGFFDVETVTQIVIILKIAFTAMAFTLYARKTVNVRGPESIFFSLCYSFGGYTICYGVFNFMFMDALILLPIVLMTTVSAFENDKYYLVTISYAFLFITNFHLGYSVGIFTLLYVLIHLFVNLKNIKKKERLIFFIKWSLSVCVAILISGVFLLPGILQFFSSGYNDATEYGARGVTILNILNTMFWGTYKDLYLNEGMLYSGIPVLILSPLFFFNRNVSCEDKIFWGVIIGVFLIFMSVTPIYYALCAFDIPDGFNYRFGFVVSFCLCVIAMKESESIKKLNIWKGVASILSILAFFLLMIAVQIVQGCEDTNSIICFAVNLGIMGIWFIAFIILKKCNISDLSKFSFVLLVIFAELISFAFPIMPNFYYKRYYYESYVDKLSEDISYLEGSDASFYRIISVNDEITNSPFLSDYNGISEFASCRNEKAAKVLNGLGFADSPRNLGSSGYTPVTEMIFDIKYLIKENWAFGGMIESDEETVVKNPLVLNVGYMVDEDLRNFTISDRNVYENSNSILEHMTGRNREVFIPTDEYKVTNSGLSICNSEDGVEIFKDGVQGGKLVMSLPYKDEYDNAYMQFETDVSKWYEEDYYYVTGGENIFGNRNELYSSQANEMYYNSVDDKYMITLSAGEEAYDKYVIRDINVVYFSKDALEEYYEDLSKEQLQVEEWKDGYIKGHIDVDSNRRLLFLSIPYEKGWNITLNGEKINPIAVVDDTFMAIELPGTGSYDIEMKFKCPGVTTGLIITSSGILLTLFMFLFEKKKSDKKNIDGKEKETVYA